jgi:hypothetical protein
MRLTSEFASRFARIALGHVGREYPNKLDHVVTGPGDLLSQRALHPIFYGSFDWHSCVHGYWLLARIYRRFPDLPEARDVRALFDRQLTPEKVAGEVAYLARPSARGFERPYGWAWALMLASELGHHTSEEGKRWAAALRPLTEAFAKSFHTYLPIATYPVRAGVHSNTAFALVLAMDYAATFDDTELAALCREKARAWYGNDCDAQAWEPSQDEFLSPTLTQAACMQVAVPEAFAGWFAKFLPRAANGEPATLFTPATVSDRTDGKIAHLDGLNLSRAWCWRQISRRLEPPLRAFAETTAARHIASALPHVAGDYAGEHWLATYALLALDC